MIALIEYRMGNLFSVQKALESVGAAVEVVENPAELDRFAACVLPGVGNFGDGAEALRGRGWPDALRRHTAAGKPFLGICLGMQLLLDSSDEAPGVPGLGLIPGRVLRFPDRVGKIPQIGWNQVRWTGTSPLTAGLNDGRSFYFVHSFYACPDNPAMTAGICEYGMPFAAALSRGSIFATQFHPEKSQRAGLELLRRWAAPEPPRE